jgi:hypothetical protein
MRTCDGHDDETARKNKDLRPSFEVTVGEDCILDVHAAGVSRRHPIDDMGWSGRRTRCISFDVGGDAAADAVCASWHYQAAYGSAAAASGAGAPVREYSRAVPSSIRPPPGSWRAALAAMPPRLGTQVVGDVKLKKSYG